ncbi:MAG: alpha-glucosidase C-terminal domain-containing protein, partial [Anaerolineales bacterium]|nr:alpha-glucosidase C-terminal domain-containing protein [Anaerolineales bacterium]
ADWAKYKKRNNLHSLEGHIFHGFRAMIELRKSHEVFAGGDLEVIPVENEHVLAFARSHAGKRAVVFVNFSEVPQTVKRRTIEQYSIMSLKKLHGRNHVSPKNVLTLEPLDFVVFG